MATATPTPAGATTRRQPLYPFTQIELRDPVNRVDLVAEPADHEAVSMTGPEEMLDRVRLAVSGETLFITLTGSLADHVRDALTTSLTRRRLTYRVVTRRLVEVRVRGLVHVSVDAFGDDAPEVRSLGPRPPIMPILGSGA
ncbi:MAG TPA: hypothetical protein VFY23_15215 [Candidatus Limnocylindrales bacterium]|nr:hypothetical protein [Candidatus Limnocylindrales bacterium]